MSIGARTAVLLALWLAGCASVPGVKSAPGAADTPQASAAQAPRSASASPGRPQPNALPPFAEVIQGATQQLGWLPGWRKADRFWLEIAPELLLADAPPVRMSVNVSSSVGERGFYAGWMGPHWLVRFHKLAGPQIQVLALNASYVAADLPLQVAVKEGFSNSLVAAMTVVSEPHPERKSVLVDASSLVADLMSYSTSLERAFRLPYNLDRNHSFIEQLNVTPDQTSVTLRLHFSTPRLPAQNIPNSPPVVLPSTPDPRSLFVGMIVNFSPLPDQPMRPRLADTRLGHFSDPVTDVSDEHRLKPRQLFINRWRLEKQDPSAPLSKPRQPIVYWLDKNIPLRYRDAVTAGILEWRKAFEAIGFQDAIEVRQQADDASWSTLDARHASVRWYLGADASVAIGPHHSDPRTGEILDADIAMSDVFGRSARRLIDENSDFSAQMDGPGLGVTGCQYGQRAVAEMAFAMDLLEARGMLEPGSPEAEALVQAVVKDVITHEVGHTLGLRHNFKGSTAYTLAQLQDKTFTAERGLSASVMDYNGINLPLQHEPPSTLVQPGVGPYDRWALEYAYRPFEPAQEAAELAKIAARSVEPGLAYANDADAGSGFGGIDPMTNRFDLGNDPLAYWARRLQLARELWQRVQDRGFKPGDDVTRQRRVLLRGFARLGSAADLASKYVGGVYTSRSAPAVDGVPAYTPVPAAQQRAALKLLTQGFFNADSFRFKPEFLARAVPDEEEGERSGPPSVPAAVLQVQVAALERLYSPATASRLLESALYTPAKSEAPMSLNEVYLTLQSAIWSELQAGQDIDSLRRNLQREHLKRIQRLLLREPVAAHFPPDALSLLRWHAKALQHQLERVARRSQLSLETRAHVQDSLSQLTQALRASMLRSGNG